MSDILDLLKQHEAYYSQKAQADALRKKRAAVPGALTPGEEQAWSAHKAFVGSAADPLRQFTPGDQTMISGFDLKTGNAIPAKRTPTTPAVVRQTLRRSAEVQAQELTGQNSRVPPNLTDALYRSKTGAARQKDADVINAFTQGFTARQMRGPVRPLNPEEAIPGFDYSQYEPDREGLSFGLDQLPFDVREFVGKARVAGKKRAENWVERRGTVDKIDLKDAATQLGGMMGVDPKKLLDPTSPEFQRVEHSARYVSDSPLDLSDPGVQKMAAEGSRVTVPKTNIGFDVTGGVIRTLKKFGADIGNWSPPEMTANAIAEGTPSEDVRTYLGDTRVDPKEMAPWEQPLYTIGDIAFFAATGGGGGKALESLGSFAEKTGARYAGRSALKGAIGTALERSGQGILKATTPLVGRAAASSLGQRAADVAAIDLGQAGAMTYANAARNARKSGKSITDEFGAAAIETAGQYIGSLDPFKEGLEPGERMAAGIMATATALGVGRTVKSFGEFKSRLQVEGLIPALKGKAIPSDVAEQLYRWTKAVRETGSQARKEGAIDAGQELFSEVRPEQQTREARAGARGVAFSSADSLGFIDTEQGPGRIEGRYSADKGIEMRRDAPESDFSHELDHSIERQFGVHQEGLESSFTPDELKQLRDVVYQRTYRDQYQREVAGGKDTNAAKRAALLYAKHYAQPSEIGRWFLDKAYADDPVLRKSSIPAVRKISEMIDARELDLSRLERIPQAGLERAGLATKGDQPSQEDIRTARAKERADYVATHPSDVEAADDMSARVDRLPHGTKVFFGAGEHTAEGTVVRHNWGDVRVQLASGEIVTMARSHLRLTREDDQSKSGQVEAGDHLKTEEIKSEDPSKGGLIEADDLPKVGEIEHPPNIPAAEIASAEGHRFTETRIDPKQIGVYPGLQYKKVGVSDTENAVTDAMKGVEKYDQATGGPLTVWERTDGKKYVINGHHRRELAIRTGEPDVPIRIFKESDGIDFSMARALGALQNIKDGKGTAIDAATVLRDLGWNADKLKAVGVNTRSGLARDAGSLLKLDREALRYVEDGDVPEAVAAGIAEANLEPRRQVATMKEAARGGLETRNQGVILGDQARTAPMIDRSGGNGDLFGELDEGLALAERARLADLATRRLASNQRLYKAMITGRAVGETVVDADAQQSAASVQEFARKVIATDHEAASILEEEAAKYAAAPTKQQLGASVDAIVAAAERAAERRLADLKRSGTGSSDPDGLRGRAAGGSELPESGLTEQLSISAPDDDEAKGLVEFARKFSDLAHVQRDAHGTIKQDMVNLEAPLSDALLKAAADAKIDLTGYTHQIDNYGVIHSLEEHGPGTKSAGQGQEPITPDDFAWIPSVLSDPDEVRFVGFEPMGNARFEYQKRVNGNLYYLEEVRSPKRGSKLLLVTMWKSKSGTSDVSEISPRSLRPRRLPGTDPSVPPESQHSISPAAPGEPSPLKQSAEETGRNYLAPLDKYADVLYRETSYSGFADMLGSFSASDRFHYSNTPDLATGQGGNRGMLLEFDAGGLQGQVNRTKPTWDHAWDSGAGEFIGYGNPSDRHLENLRAITLQPGLQMDAVQKGQWAMMAKQLLAEGWQREKLEDGGVRYTRGDVAGTGERPQYSVSFDDSETASPDRPKPGIRDWLKAHFGKAEVPPLGDDAPDDFAHVDEPPVDQTLRRPLDEKTLSDAHRADPTLGLGSRQRDAMAQGETRGVVYKGQTYRSWTEAKQVANLQNDREDILKTLHLKDSGEGVTDVQQAQVYQELGDMNARLDALDASITSAREVGNYRGADDLQRDRDALMQRYSDLSMTVVDLTSNNGRNLAAARMFSNLYGGDPDRAVRRAAQNARRPLTTAEIDRIRSTAKDIGQLEKQAMSESARRVAEAEATLRDAAKKFEGRTVTLEELDLC